MVIRLYMDYMSQPSRAVLAFCLLAKVPHEVKEVKISKLEMKSEEYLKINPMGKVPAIQDTENGFKLAQSHTIMRYLAAKYPQNVGDWYPSASSEKDLVQRAKIDEYLDFHHTNTRKCAFYVFNTAFAPKIGIPTDPQYVQAQAKKQAERALKLIERHYLAKTPFLTGLKPTIADLSAYYEILFLMIVGENFQSYPKLKAWINRVGEIKQVKQANKVFIKLLPKMNPNAKL